MFVQCRTPAGTWGVAKCSLYTSNEAASSRDREDKRFPPSEKTRKRERGRLSPHRTCCAQRCSPAGQAGWESQPSFRQKCKKEAGGEKGKDKVKLEGGRLQTNPPQRKAPQQTLLWSQQCRRYYSAGERVMLKYKPLFTCSPKFLNSC